MRHRGARRRQTAHGFAVPSWGEACRALGVLGSLLVLACGSPDDDKPATTPPGTSPAGADAGPRSAAPTSPRLEVRAVSCSVTLGTPGFQQPASQHVPPNTAINYCSTSGPHYAVWAEFRTTRPRGALALPRAQRGAAASCLYKCDTPCPRSWTRWKAVRDRAPPTPRAEQGRAGPEAHHHHLRRRSRRGHSRAWGATYGDCVDGPHPNEFVAKKGQNAREPSTSRDRACFSSHRRPPRTSSAWDRLRARVERDLHAVASEARAYREARPR